ncbi:methyltransferase domain-containing protein [Paenibacillus allorhizosphaerae]|uniref:2-methoxy-6-polyprenyl-1,4-benzoquinol methylase, mitochondrial n=1 Tax=Paenibacillus allorhizosphaerae TaxID=2849866 RepID=A0ABM8VKH0_9BACL|nr:methyltransferase domain-containing protein [Paenibacillus allorhizosphaerae]CAG7646980.1 2-methoxy-6-polyprenyl-1,4-benzoquinol methylase, mitochondrial [Paenibacillus allorhizosphaerae]
MQIKEIAAKLNISPRAIRFYEEKGLIHPAKSAENQYRSFTENDVWKLQCIIALREVGMSIEDIRLALIEVDAGNQSELLSLLEIQRSVMFSQWLELKQMVETTDQMIAMVKQKQTLPLADVYTLAEGSKRLRELRKSWHDRWNFDKLAPLHDERVASGSGADYRNYDEALTQTMHWVAPAQGEYGLDIGTGTGNLAGRLLMRGIRMAAIDQSKEMLKHCLRKYPGLETKLGNFLSLPFTDRQFDFIVSSYAFHHLTDEEKMLALAEMKRVLKPHGRICITDLMFENEAKRRYPEPAHPADERHYADVSRLIDWFEANGYLATYKLLDDMLCILYAVPIWRQ